MNYMKRLSKSSIKIKNKFYKKNVKIVYKLENNSQK